MSEPSTADLVARLRTGDAINLFPDIMEAAAARLEAQQSAMRQAREALQKTQKAGSERTYLPHGQYIEEPVCAVCGGPSCFDSCEIRVAVAALDAALGEPAPNDSRKPCGACDGVGTISPGTLSVKVCGVCHGRGTVERAALGETDASQEKL